MLHRWNMYVNQGDRRIPSLVQSGEVELPCTNPDDEPYLHLYDPEPLWLYLQIEADLSYDGLYLSLVCAERPTYDGKQWFVRAAYNPSPIGMRQEPTREVSWNNIKGLQFWNASFRDYTRLTSARSIIDYTVYVSRAFGYCFLVGLRFGEDDDDARDEFTNFYPSLHHYHKQLAFSELETYQPFNDNYNWFPKDYGQDDAPALTTEEGVASVVEAANLITESMGEWRDAVSGVGLDNLIDLGEDILEDEDIEEDN